MSLSPSCPSLFQKRSLRSLLGSRQVKRPRLEDGQRLQEAAVQLLEQHQSLSRLLRENPDSGNMFLSKSGEQKHAACEDRTSTFTGRLLVCELRHQAEQLGVPVLLLSVKVVLERLMEITGTEAADEDKRRELLTSSQRVQLCVLLQSSRDLLSQGALCPKLLWQEYRRDEKRPNLEVVCCLHSHSILDLKSVLESDEGVRSWLVPRLKALCSWKPPEDEEDTRTVQQEVLSVVAGVLVGGGFERRREPPAADRKLSLLCCSVLDDVLFWFLDAADKCPTQTSAGAEVEPWTQIFDASLCGASLSADALQRFFSHSLTQTLTYRPRLTVSDAVTLQNQWSFAKASRLLTCLLRQLSVTFPVELLLHHLQQVLETNEVNWKHVLCFLSTLLVYHPGAQPSLTELLSRLLASAFDGYDLEKMITAFLLARQGTLEGPSVFPSYSDWFKMCFGGSSSCHANSKKSLVFLLKFLSDLVPFEPPQYLKVHILHPPYIPVKHRSLLMEYISLAKTRLADLKESVEDMCLYEESSATDGASQQPQCQAVQDVEKAVSLFESTGRISATVLEASIFRRPYFLTRFLPALLTPRVLPVKDDARMSFIDALKKADKIPAAQHSSYLESCRRRRQQDRSTVCVDTSSDPLDVLGVQLQEFTVLAAGENDGEMLALLSRIVHTLSVVFPSRPEEPTGRTVIELHVDFPPPELHVKAIDMILRSFCQCVLDTSRANPANRQSPWARRVVTVLLGNTSLLCCLVHRLWDLLHNKGSSLQAAHLLGLAALVVQLCAATSHSPLLVLMPPVLQKPVPVEEAVSSALVCSTGANMIFCVRLCVAAVCYGICRGDASPLQQKQEHVPSSLYKKLLYLIPRLLPEARRASVGVDGLDVLWSAATFTSSPWRKTAGHLWRLAAFQQLQHVPQYQLLFSEWLDNELRVQRSADALSDSERQEYQQWACMELYLPRPEEQGGCGGDVRELCSRLLKALLDQQLRESRVETLDPGASHKDGCRPDILSRLQELLYEMEVTELSSSRRSVAHACDFLFDLVSQSFPTPASTAAALGLQHTLAAWNRVLLALPPSLFVNVRTEAGTQTLDCRKLMDHINQHQRMVCSPAVPLSCPVTAHFLRGLIYASVRCGRPGPELNRAWSQICLHCPLLLISTLHWWEHLSPVLLSLWSRLSDGEALPEQLQLISTCLHWASSVEKSRSAAPLPAAPALLLAASLRRVFRARGSDAESFSVALRPLRADGGEQSRQVLLLLLCLCVTDDLSGLLQPQEDAGGEARSFCSDLLSALVDRDDWLLLFKPDEQAGRQVVTMATSDEFARLMPWAFYNLLLRQSPALLHRAVRCPGFLQTAVLCYIRLLQLFLEGHTTLTLQPPEQQILSSIKQLVLGLISLTPPATLSSGRLGQLQAQCAELDPEVAAALSVHLGPHGLSPEMDFL